MTTKPDRKKLMLFSESVATNLLESGVKSRATNWLLPCVIEDWLCYLLIVFTHLFLVVWEVECNRLYLTDVDSNVESYLLSIAVRG